MSDELHVVFGSGPVGLAVVDELVKRGRRVRVVNRRGSAAVPANVEVVAGDAADPASARRLCQGAAVVYNCVNAPDYHRWHIQFPPLQAGILEGAAAAGAKLIVMENLYMYGPNGGRPLTEDAPMNPTSGTRCVTRAQMARDLFAAHRAGTVRAASVRASDFFGPRVLDSAAGERLFGALLHGKPVQYLGDVDVLHSYTYMPDIGRAMALLAEHDAALGEAWHIPSATVTPRQFIQMAAAALGLEPKISVLRRGLLRAVALPVMGWFIPPLRGYDEVLYQFDEPFVVDASKFIRTFGDIQTPLETAVNATARWYQEQAAARAAA